MAKAAVCSKLFNTKIIFNEIPDTGSAEGPVWAAGSGSGGTGTITSSRCKLSGRSSPAGGDYLQSGVLDLVCFIRGRKRLSNTKRAFRNNVGVNRSEPTRRILPDRTTSSGFPSQLLKSCCVSHISSSSSDWRLLVSVPDEREAVQKKTFTKWVNSHLSRVSCRITDLYMDLRDGRMLIKLLEVLSGERLVGWAFILKESPFSETKSFFLLLDLFNNS